MLGIRLGVYGGMSSALFARFYDPDSLAFFARANVTDSAVRRRHDTMVRWLKAQGLWEFLYIWCEADAGALFDADNVLPAGDGETVAALINRRGDQGDFRQSTANRLPVMASNGLFGRPALRFDGDNDLLVGDAYGRAALRKTAGVSIVASYHDINQTGGPGNHSIIHASTGASANDTWVLLTTRGASPNYGYGGVRRVGTDVFSVAQFTSPPNGPSVASHLIDFSGGIHRLYHNGALQNTATITAGLSEDVAASSISIGAFQTNFNFFPGYIGGFFVFRVALTLTQEAHVRAHLAYL